MQMLFDRSYEDGECDGLGLIGGEVVRFGKENDASWDESNKIPHMGWNQLVKNREDRIADGVADGEYAYFVHSYYAVPKNWEDVVYYADYSVRVPGVARIKRQCHRRAVSSGEKLGYRNAPGCGVF